MYARLGGALGVPHHSYQDSAHRTMQRAFTAAHAAARAIATRSSSGHVPLPIVYHPLYSAPRFKEGHTFPMQVFERIHERLLDRGIVHPSQVHCPDVMPTAAQLHLAHCPDYVAAFRGGTLGDKELRRIGFPWSEVLVERTESEVAGTLLTARLALQHGIACNTAGGTHHAHRDFGSGFCIFNDLAVTARLLLGEGLVSRVLVLDLDVHQGDGTAAILQGDDRVFTLSVHCQDNFPARKQASDLDVGLRSGAGDAEYMRAISEVVPGALQDFRPDLVLYDAGVRRNRYPC
mmetsp:Transcript_25314/g.80093  ORF Transcript_25314/g.80093 Transcript_25314/m.80093 type:complete len:290 (+) Transcript_25314:297-1166(+)